MQPTEDTYDTVLGKCVRTTYTDKKFAILAPPGWCDHHSSHYYEDAGWCERRLDLQTTVERVLKTMGGDSVEGAVPDANREPHPTPHRS